MNRKTFYRLDLTVVSVVALMVLASCLGIRPTAAAQPLEPPEETPSFVESPLVLTGEQMERAPDGTSTTDDSGLDLSDAEDEAKGCEAGPGEAIYTDPAGAFCFAFPSSMTLNGSGPRTVSLVGPPLVSTPEALFVSLGITASPAPVTQLQAGVDAALAEYADFAAWEITRSEATLGGVPALRVEPVPGRLSSRDLFAQKGDLLYRLSFWPAQMEPIAPDLEALYSSVTRSFRFLEPAAEPSTQAAGAIQGIVLHGDEPVADALVTLRLPNWRTDPGAVVMETSTAPNGTYALVGVPAGSYEVVAAWPGGRVEGMANATGYPVAVGDGVTTVSADLSLAAGLTLTEPAAEEEASSRPTIRWAPVDGAARYRVIVVDRSTSESPFAGDVDVASVALEQPLDAGHTYEVIVNALTAQGGLLATGGGAFTVAP